jgi:diguanylate cyclase (GGDEF)-like protein
MQDSAGDRLAGATILITDLRPILEVLKNINTERNLRRLLGLVLDRMLEFCNARRGMIGIFRKDTFKAKLARDRSGDPLGAADLEVFQSVLKYVRDKGGTVMAPNAHTHPGSDPRPLSLLCLPLRIKDKILGAVYLDHPGRAGAFGPRQTEIAEVLTEHAAIAIENTLLHHRTIHDRLTRVFNHGQFEKELHREVSRTRRLGLPCGLVMIDVDDFKKINDTFGHDAGNAVLKHMATTLARGVRADDIVARIRERPGSPVVARYGGDEFEVLLPGVDAGGALRTAERLVEILSRQKLRFGDRDLRLSISAGVAVVPDHAQDAHELFLKADEALYESKRAGKNRALLYRPRPPGALK